MDKVPESLFEEIGTFAKDYSVTKSPDGAEKIAGSQQDRDERKKYAKLTFWLVVSYLFIVFVILFFTGFNLIQISDTVLIALVVTSFAQVVGLFAFVMRYLFSKNS